MSARDLESDIVFIALALSFEALSQLTLSTMLTQTELYHNYTVELEIFKWCKFSYNYILYEAPTNDFLNVNGTF